MVVLGVVFKDLCLLGVLKVLDQVVEVDFLPPGLAVNEPEQYMLALPPITSCSRIVGEVGLRTWPPRGQHRISVHARISADKKVSKATMDNPPQQAEKVGSDSNIPESKYPNDR